MFSPVWLRYACQRQLFWSLRMAKRVIKILFGRLSNILKTLWITQGRILWLSKSTCISFLDEECQLVSSGKASRPFYYITFPSNTPFRSIRTGSKVLSVLFAIFLFTSLVNTYNGQKKCFVPAKLSVVEETPPTSNFREIKTDIIIVLLTSL